MTAASDKAAKQFFNTLLPNVGFDYTDHKAKPLLRAAFALYEAEWRVPGQTWRISEWMWPFAELTGKDRGEDRKRFDGDQPWTILLRRAVELARPASNGGGYAVIYDHDEDGGGEERECYYEVFDTPAEARKVFADFRSGEAAGAIRNARLVLIVGDIDATD